MGSVAAADEKGKRPDRLDPAFFIVACSSDTDCRLSDTICLPPVMPAEKVSATSITNCGSSHERRIRISADKLGLQELTTQSNNQRAVEALRKLISVEDRINLADDRKKRRKQRKAARRRKK